MTKQINGDRLKGTGRRRVFFVGEIHYYIILLTLAEVIKIFIKSNTDGRNANRALPMKRKLCGGLL